MLYYAVKSSLRIVRVTLDTQTEALGRLSNHDVFIKGPITFINLRAVS